MFRNSEILMAWVKFTLTIAAVCTTAFPILFTLSPWYRSRLGRAMMLQGIAFALAVDLTLLGWFWKPNIWTILWIAVVVYTLIAIATAYLTYMMCLMNYKQQVPTEEIVNEQARAVKQRGPVQPHL